MTDQPTPTTRTTPPGPTGQHPGGYTGAWPAPSSQPSQAETPSASHVLSGTFIHAIDRTSTSAIPVFVTGPLPTSSGILSVTPSVHAAARCTPRMYSQQCGRTGTNACRAATTTCINSPSRASSASISAHDGAHGPSVRAAGHTRPAATSSAVAPAGSHGPSNGHSGAGCSRACNSSIDEKPTTSNDDIRPTSPSSGRPHANPPITVGAATDTQGPAADAADRPAGGTRLPFGPRVPDLHSRGVTREADHHRARPAFPYRGRTHRQPPTPSPVPEGAPHLRPVGSVGREGLTASLPDRGAARPPAGGETTPLPPTPPNPKTTSTASPVKTARTTNARKELSAMSARDKLTVQEVITELQVSRRTFQEWRAKGCAPRCLKLPNGELRIRRSDLDRWLDSREEL
jgi:predicted DNA-binding transcriptional regulator AlpA